MTRELVRQTKNTETLKKKEWFIEEIQFLQKTMSFYLLCIVEDFVIHLEKSELAMFIK